LFVHAVYFWLRDDLSVEDRATFETLVRELPSIEHVTRGYIGVPADTTREIVDRSYSLAEILIFEDRAAHDAYQAHPTPEVRRALLDLLAEDRDLRFGGLTASVQPGVGRTTLSRCVPASAGPLLLQRQDSVEADRRRRGRGGAAATAARSSPSAWSQSSSS
jgi:hypothetical protein